MATRMGAPGVRIELHDRSGYSLVETPNAVGGVVGFAPKGELNKIQLLTNTAEQDTYFGLGFNNSRYNQGMYAARAVINAGGHVEFVRPYGEEIDKTSDKKRDLKTDAFVVAYDHMAVTNSHNPGHRSIKVDYFAATRYKTDGAARYGVTRKINNIAETITNGSNVNFNVDAAEDYTQKDNWVDAGKGGVARGESDMVMFALMNADPSSANRAYATYAVESVDQHTVVDTEIKVNCKSKVGFAVEDVVYGPAKNSFKGVYGFRVTNIVDRKVSLAPIDEATKQAVQAGYEPDVLIYGDTDGASAAADGYDYLSVKTAVTGRGAKTFASLHFGKDTLAKTKALPSGTPLEFMTQSGDSVAVRLDTPGYLEGVTTTAQGTYEVITLDDDPSIYVGDTLQVERTVSGKLKTALYAVTGVADGKVTATFVSSAVAEADLEDTFGGTKADVSIKNFAANWVDGVDVLTLSVTGKSTLASVVADLVKLLGYEELGYGNSPVIGDITVDDETGKASISEDGKSVTLVDGAAVEFVPGDTVAITRGSVDIVRDASESEGTDEALVDDTVILYVGTVKESDPITNVVTLTDAIPVDLRNKLDEAELKFQMVNLTQTNKTVFAATDTYDYKPAPHAIKFNPTWELVSAGSSEVNPTYKLASVTCTPDLAGLTAGDHATVTITDDNDSVYEGEVNENLGIVIDTTVNHEIVVEGTRESDADVEPVRKYDGTVYVTSEETFEEFADIYLVGNYDTTVPVGVQNDTAVADVSPIEVEYKFYSKAENHVVDHSDKVITDSTIGGTFVSLGLARIQYMDVNFTGDTVRVYDLTDEGEAVARLYLSVAYMYNGIRYEFDGTVVPYVYNDMQLYIGDSAETELEGSGVYFVLNDSGVMDLFREDNSYDLSATVESDADDKIIPSGTTVCPAFNVNDPAIVNDAVWTYDPASNMSTSTISNAFNLFLDKDKSDVTFFVGAGLGVNNFGLKGYETLNTQLMQAILSICELRKDCFALFDGVADSRINTTLKLDSPASRFGSTLGRWGAIYDARPIFFDSIVTKMNVEVAPSVAMASLITANRKGSIWWYPPAGEDTGMIPGAWCRKVKYERKFNIPEDTESDIARLCDIHVNPFRTNKKGIYSYGDFTMQMEDTAFNAINVTMLVAGIHKMFYNYLDSRVFRINTASLRSQITTDLQGQLDKIIGENPAGLEPGSVVICDDTNNPPEVVEAHKLMVDLMLYPTTTSRYIYLRTNVLSRANGNTITTELSTGNR